MNRTPPRSSPSRHVQTGRLVPDLLIAIEELFVVLLDDHDELNVSIRISESRGDVELRIAFDGSRVSDIAALGLHV